jgi:hypothetical protein
VAGSITLPVVYNNSAPASWFSNSRHSEIPKKRASSSGIAPSSRCKRGTCGPCDMASSEPATRSVTEFATEPATDPSCDQVFSILKLAFESRFAQRNEACAHGALATLQFTEFLTRRNIIQRPDRGFSKHSRSSKSDWKRPRYAATERDPRALIFF